VLPPQGVFATSFDVDIVATVPGCGDSIIQSGEQCDGPNLGGASCSYIGFSSGVLSCSSVCTLVTTACVLTPPNTSQSQIIKPKPEEVASFNSNLVVIGFSSPYARVSLLKDGHLAATVFSDDLGFFKITVSGLNPADYLLKLVSSGDYGGLVFGDSFMVEVHTGLTTMISGVYLPPDFSSSVKDNTVTIKGLAVPNSLIVFEGGVFDSEVKTGSEGRFSVSYSLDALSPSYQGEIRVGLKYGGGIAWSPLGNIYTEGVKSNCAKEADVTGDCRVNFVDFIIMLWWYLYNPASATLDLDNNNELNLTDFSILAYYWTG
jgi:hypothetical protein